jgi:hypothetical protein
MPGYFHFIPVERPPGSVDLEDKIAADYALEQARDGDPAPLLERLRSDRLLSQEERALAADIIEANWKQTRPGRPARTQTQGKALLMALDVSLRMASGDAEKAAVELAAASHSVSRPTVRNAVREHPELFVAARRRRRPRKRTSNK